MNSGTHVAKSKKLLRTVASKAVTGRLAGSLYRLETRGEATDVSGRAGQGHRL